MGRSFSIFNYMLKYILLISFFFIIGCSDNTTNAPINDCLTTSDTTRVCGDTEFYMY